MVVRLGADADWKLMTAWRAKISAESQGAILLVAGISIFGFSDNLTMLVSDDVGVGHALLQG